nr:type I pullulanase [uncultured Acetatifactor sp.]
MKKRIAENMAFFASEEFEAKFRYDGKDLGAVCTEGSTVFKVWSPLAQRVELRLYRDQTGESFFRKELHAGEKGVWKLAFQENLHGIYYDYLVRTEGKDTRTADPYAVGCSCNGGRSMVVDLRQTDPPGFQSDSAPKQSAERIIYELHIKDFSYDMESGVPEAYRGKYKAFTVTGTGGEYPTCMEYLKKLGITHVHLLPFFDFGSVDEAGDENQFNWGYDPVNYNVPEGSYATDVSDGTVRIRECKEMIQALHNNGIRVIMDVVYNHTHQHDSWFQRMVPDYYYRYMEDGSLSNGSACGNDIAAGRSMVDNYIADSVMYWAREYHLDGFRFDLMGLLTVELMNRIRTELDDAFGVGEKMLYGEPWSADDSPMEKGTRPAEKKNTGYLSEGIGIFSDDTRDVIKGSVFYSQKPGFVNGGERLESAILHAAAGWKDGGACFMPKSCGQIINYVSAHDNFTLWDKLVLSMHREEADFDRQYEDVLAANKLAAFIYFTCQGNLFLQAGEEFGRTKWGEDNSYCSTPELNMLRWHRTVEYGGLVEYYKGLIRLRKRLPGLCDKSPDAAARITGGRIHGDGVVSFLVDNRDDRRSSWEELFIVYNASCEDQLIEIPETVWIAETEQRAVTCAEEGKGQPEGRSAGQQGMAQAASREDFWEVLADEKEADCRRRAEITENSVRVAAHGGMLLGKRKE